MLTNNYGWPSLHTDTAGVTFSGRTYTPLARGEWIVSREGSNELRLTAPSFPLSSSQTFAQPLQVCA